MNENVLKLFNQRYACKQYAPNRRVSDDDFMTIMEAARLSPSSFGLEPWKFILLQNETVKKKLHPIAWGAQASLKGASHFVLAFARKNVQANSDYVQYMLNDIHQIPCSIGKEIKRKFAKFQEVDFKLFDNDEALFNWASKQTYIALGNMLSVAAYLEVASCPIEGFNRAAVETLLAEYNIIDTEQYGLSYMVSFGYSTKAPRAKTRQPLSAIFAVYE